MNVSPTTACDKRLGTRVLQCRLPRMSSWRLLIRQWLTFPRRVRLCEPSVLSRLAITFADMRQFRSITFNPGCRRQTNDVTRADVHMVILCFNMSSRLCNTQSCNCFVNENNNIPEQTIMWPPQHCSSKSWHPPPHTRIRSCHRWHNYVNLIAQVAWLSHKLTFNFYSRLFGCWPLATGPSNKKK